MARTPDAVAVVDGETASDLRGAGAERDGGWRASCGRRGSGPETVVGVCWSGRGAGGGLLAVLKAGGAYVPLDPDVSAASGWHAWWRTRGLRVVMRTAATTTLALPRRVRVVALAASGPAWRRAAAGAGAGRTRDAAGVRDLHVGVDRAAEGRDEHARRRW